MPPSPSDAAPPARPPGAVVRMERDLLHRASLGTLRRLPPPAAASPSSPSAALADFASNDYLGLARCPRQRELVDRDYALRARADRDAPALGATGSRLLSGNSAHAVALEERLGRAHGFGAASSALLFGSGYDANLGVFSCVPAAGDVVVTDERCHNSIFMGLRMGRRGVRSVSFRHNDVDHLGRLLREITGREEETKPHVFVAVESVYSMDGDICPLADVLDLSARYGAGSDVDAGGRVSVIVDEAHGVGVYGETNVSDLSPSDSPDPAPDAEEPSPSEPPPSGPAGGAGVLASLGLATHPALLCAVYTFGKAMGCHGAAVVSRHAPMASYLVNYARPLVYSTAPGLHSLVAIDHAYRTVAGPEGGRRRRRLFRLVRLFRERCRSAPELRGRVLPSPSPIQAVTFPGNRRCQAAAEELRRGGFDLYPIRFPTVEKGRERIRIVLHAHNKEEEVVALVGALRRVCRRDGAGNVASRL